MNFSNNKMLRKILSLVIAMMMVTTLFTGCMGKDENTLPTDPPIDFSEPTAPATTPTETVPPTTEEINENMATVLEELHVRSSPSDGAADVGTLYPGDKVEILQTATALQRTWGRIEKPHDGWICLDFVEWAYKPNDGADSNGSTDGEGQTGNNGGSSSNTDTVVAKGTVTAKELNIRKDATTDSERVGGLKKGDRVEILEKKNGWGRIKDGWISLDHVKLDSNNENSNNSGSNNNSNTKPSEGNGSTKVISRGIVYKTDNLNIRASATQDSERVGGLKGGDRVEIYEKSGNWGRIDEGWISLSYVYIDGTGIGNNKTGTITGDSLRIRSGPGTKYDTVGSLNSGDEVTILFRVTIGDTTWGNIKQGWISMKYVELDEPDDGDDVNDDDDGGISWVGGGDSDTDKGNGSSDVIARGIVTANGLNIRKSASGDSDKVGSLKQGTRVEILEKDGFWGRIKQGWISLEYVYEDGTGDGGAYARVTDSLNIRSGPSSDYDKVGSLEEGDEVEVLYTLKVDGAYWYNIKEGWIAAKYTTPLD